MQVSYNGDLVPEKNDGISVGTKTKFNFQNPFKYVLCVVDRYQIL